ncbi:hypothetical protein M378DRAFT_13873 [Amanita muscaria Koide BX008]|uniref:Uncharacterized protein n=1 Tax=Amanita muscaria (strain Koide BX008) TaxID=946122 RepID=A0A0C2T2W7_AMAMK|nr:hypothetical protein M378DRAFT_13873 [Amanita muscaria Koide BX008]
MPLCKATNTKIVALTQRVTSVETELSLLVVRHCSFLFPTLHSLLAPPAPPEGPRRS